MSIHESGENYLEQILVLSRSLERVRAVDLCTALGFSRPTVSVMLRQLREGGFVTTADNGGLALTPKGEEIANRIYSRHKIMTQFLILLGVSPDVAAEDACKMEHVISDETFEAMKRHLSEY